MNAKQIWQTVIERLQTKVETTAFTTWFQETLALSFEEGTFTVGVPTTFAKAHLEGRFYDMIHSTLADVVGQPTDIKFVVTKKVSEQLPLLDDSDLLPPNGRRSYRVKRPRFSIEQRERRIADAATAAMHSLAPTSSSSGVHLNPDEEEDTRLLHVPEIAEQDEADMQTMRGMDSADSMPTMQGNVPMQESQFSLVSSIPSPHEGLLNPRYTFKSFIVGKSNQLAHVAALAVAENPGRVYNPLFFYGGVGLGKTHLLHAIGHVGEETGLNVLYVTSEKFTNEIVNAIRFQKTEEFRAKYRQIDILLVDDIQFIVGKESTEEEFFHTFNTLHNANKQIVVTSDRPPKAIHSLQDRLRSRFEWGLLADIQPPEYEHRLAILRSKAESLHFPIPNAVIEYIARPECSSVRELEGALNRVIAYGTLHGAALTPQLAAQALAHIYSDVKPSSGGLNPREVIEGVCRYYHIDPSQIRGKQRDREIAWPRQVAMYLMREETSASLQQIGFELGGRDHTTIMHGWEKVHSEMSTNDRIRREIAAVLESLQPGKM